MKIDHSIEFEPLDGTPTRDEINQRRLKMYIQGLHEDQRPEFGRLVGILIPFFCAFLWLLLNYYTDWQAGYLAVPIGLLTGLLVRWAGRGLERHFGWVAAFSVVFGSLLGHYNSIIMGVARFHKLTFIQIFGQISIEEVPDYLWHKVSWVDLVFLAIGAVIAFFLSWRNVSQAEIDRIMK